MSEYGSDGNTGDSEEPTDGFVAPSTPHDAGSGGSPFDVTPGSDDVIGSTEPERKSSRVPVLVAMVAVIVVVLAGGALAFIKGNSSTASALTKLVPADAYGYVQLDLKQSSSAGLYEYLSHFPGSPATKPDAKKATFRDTLLGTVFTKSNKINYSRDIQPWLGNSAGVAVFRGTNGDPVPLVIVATTDAAKAKAGLARLHQGDSSFAYDIIDGDVLLAQHQTDLDAAQAQSKSGGLTSSGTYSADIATLPSGSLVTMWADLDKVTAAVKSAMSKVCASGGSSFGGSCGAFSSLTGAGALGGLGGVAGLNGGRVAVGVSVADKVATVTVRELGHKAGASTATIGDEIKGLPGDTTGAIAFGDVSAGLTSSLTSLSSLSGLALGLGGTSEISSSGSATASGMAIPEVSAGVAMPSAFPSMDPAAIASLEAKMKVEANAQVASAAPSLVPVPTMSSAYSSGLSVTTGAADLTKQMTDGIASATGLKFPDDFVAMLGDRTVVAVGDIPLKSSDLKDLQVGIRSHPKDAAKAQTLAQTLIQHVSSTGIPFKLGTKTVGGDFVLASSQSYADTLAGSGNLGSGAQFQAAMGDLSQAHFAVYVDLSKFTGILSATKDKELSGFKALGIVERTDGSDAVIQLKLIAG
jgi:Protein of unknown function (DUF3352)